MNILLHKKARATPAIRQEIHASTTSAVIFVGIDRATRWVCFDWLSTSK